MAKLSNVEITSLLFDDQAGDPSTPASTKWRLYAKAAGFHIIDDGGVVSRVTAELAYTEFTGNVSITATTEATANTIVTASAVTFDGSTIALIEFWARTVVLPAAAQATMDYYLYQDGASIGRLGTVRGADAAAGVEQHIPYLVRRMTPASGARTYSIRAAVNTGTGTIGAGAGGLGVSMPGFIRIVRT